MRLCHKLRNECRIIVQFYKVFIFFIIYQLVHHNCGCLDSSVFLLFSPQELLWNRTGLTKPSHLDWLRNEVIHQGTVFNFMHFYEHFIHDLCFCTFNMLILKDISHFMLYEIKSGQKMIHLASFLVLVFSGETLV